jgi:hypothetical protein
VHLRWNGECGIGIGLVRGTDELTRGCSCVGNGNGERLNL